MGTGADRGASMTRDNAVTRRSAQEGATVLQMNRIVTPSERVVHGFWEYCMVCRPDHRLGMAVRDAGSAEDRAKDFVRCIGGVFPRTRD